MFSRSISRTLILAAAVACPGSALAATGLLVPAYFSPQGSNGAARWDALASAAGDVPVIAIMNPNSGPGTSFSNAYADVIADLHANGGRVIGYVSTDYANRSAAAIKADIDLYQTWYDIDGIFLDEFTNDNDAGDLAFYEGIYGYGKSIDSGWTIVGNPGTRASEAYASRPTADILVVEEQAADDYDSYTPSGWNANYSADRLAHLVHTQSTASGMLGDLDQAVAQNAGWVYVTDDELDNPWDRLPTYWDQEVARLVALNTIPEPALGIFMLGGLLLCRRR